MNLAQIGNAAKLGFTLAKRMAKTTAILGATYWLINRVLNFRHPRYDTIGVSTDSSVQPTIETLRVITDGKVTIRPSNDNFIKISHKYGASCRADLPNIRFSQTFDEEHKTLTVKGLLDECHTGKFHRFIQWLFHVRPERTLHHIIEVPHTTNVEITTGSSDDYTHNKTNFTAVHIDSIQAKIKVFANAGNVLIENSGATNKLTEIKTPDQVIVNDFNGDLSVYNAKNFQIKRNPRNDHGQIRYNDILQSFLLAYPPSLEQAYHWLKTPTPHLDPEELVHAWTPEQLQLLRQIASPEQIQLWTVKQLQIWTPEQLQHWTLDRLRWWADHSRPNQLEHWTHAQLQQWTAEQLRPLLPEQLQHITDNQLLQFWPEEQLQLLTQQWTADQLQFWIREQLQRWIPEQLQHKAPDQLQFWTPEQLLHLNQHKEWKTEQLQHWTPEQLQHTLPEQLHALGDEELKYWIPQQLKLQTNGWKADQLQRWLPEPLQNWKELLLRNEQIRQQS